MHGEAGEHGRIKMLTRALTADVIKAKLRERRGRGLVLSKWRWTHFDKTDTIHPSVREN